MGDNSGTGIVLMESDGGLDALGDNFTSPYPPRPTNQKKENKPPKALPPARKPGGYEKPLLREGFYRGICSIRTRGHQGGGK